MEGSLGSIMGSKRRVLMVIVMIFIISMNLEFSNAVVHPVGGSKISWAPNINFTDWSSSQRFHLGDWLYFGYNKNQFNVLEVNETSYENCVDKDFIRNITKGGGRDVVELTEAKTYYFLSGGGYCFQGMKVMVPVEADPPSPALVPRPNHSPPPLSAAHYITTCAFMLFIFMLISL